MFSLVSINRADLSATPLVPGQFVRCQDTGQSFFDVNESTRLEVKEVKYVKNGFLKELDNPSYISLYVVTDIEPTRVYYFNSYYGTEYPGEPYDIEVTTIERVLAIISNMTLTEKSIVRYTTELDENGEYEYGERYYAPLTFAANVITDENGTSLKTVLDEASNVTLVKTSVAYRQIVGFNVRTVEIPFPVLDFDLESETDSMAVLRNGIRFSDFTIRGNQLTKVSGSSSFNEPDVITFVFYWLRRRDLNSGVVLNTNNIADGAITIDKLDPAMKLSTDMVDETENQMYVTREMYEYLEELPSTIYGIQNDITDLVSRIADTFTKTQSDNRYVRK